MNYSGNRYRMLEWLWLLMCLAGANAVYADVKIASASLTETSVNISGTSSLPDGSILTLALRSKTVTIGGSRTELLGIYKTAVLALGRWAITIDIAPYAQSKSLPDGYEIEARHNDSKAYYYLDTMSASEHRLKETVMLQQAISDFWQLDIELYKLIISVEEAKRPRTEIERQIETALGTYKTKEEAIKDLIRKWTEWEDNWLKQLDGLYARLYKTPETPRSLITTHEEIERLFGIVREQYIKYRWRFLGAAKPISYHTVVDTIDLYRNPDETKNNLSRILQKELANKLLQDVIGQIELAARLTSDRPTERNARLAGAKDYLVRLKSEAAQYNYPETMGKVIDIINITSKLIDMLINQPEISPDNLFSQIKTMVERLLDEIR
ncbi:MAG: hypothetical protein HY762_03975 [Planctomycetes bacterium]|nr:hypothetical protein [Planctomycetota bacterium]